MSDDERRAESDSESEEKAKEDKNTTDESSSSEDEEKKKKDDKEEKAPSTRSPSPKAASPVAPVNGLTIPKEFDAMDSIAILSQVQEQFEANQRMLDSGDFHTFLDRCDLHGSDERAKNALDTVQQRISALQAKLRETVDTVVGFNTSLVRKIKDDSLDTWIVKDEIKHSEIAEEIKLQKTKFMQDGALYHSHIADAMKALAQLADCAAEMIKQAEEMAEQVVAAEEAVLVGRARYEEAVKAEEARREKEEVERQKREEKRRKLEEEEAKRKAEEEERRKEEERIKGTPEEQEMRKRREEEQRLEKERRDPRNWPKTVFQDADERTICVVRAIASENLKTEDLRVTPLDLNESNLQKLSANDEIVGQVVNVEPADMEREFEFEEPWAVAIPFTAQRNTAREPILLANHPDGSWVRMPSQEVQFEDFQGTKFVETRISDPYCTLIATFTIKTDKHQVGKKGGKINSSLDSRISISFPPAAIRVTLDAAMQVQPVENLLLTELKTKQDAFSHVVTTSHIVSLSIVKKRTTKPVTVSLPVPLDPLKKNRPATAVEKGKPESSMAARPSTAFRRSDVPDDGDEEIHIIISRPSGDDKWRELKDVEIVTQKGKDVISFDIPMVERMRFMAMRTKESISEESMAKMAQMIDDGLNIRKACFVLRQKVEDQTDVLIQVVPAHKVDRVLKNLHEEGYDDEGPPPSQEFDVTERQTFEICFRGNVRVEDLPVPLCLMYNSQLKNRILFTVCEDDKYAQKSIDCYRGFAQVFTNMITRKPVAREEAGQKKMVNEEKEERVKLCELLINIPKTITETPRPVSRARFRFTPHDCVDEEFLRHLASCLTNEWKSLAEELGLPSTRIQAIQRNHVQGAAEDMITDMLLTWVKKMPAAISKTKPLAHALDRCGRPDLADELREKQRDFERAK